MRLWALSILLLVGSLCRVTAGDSMIALPFGLSWGTASADVEAAVVAAGGKVVDRQGTPETKESWAAEGLKQDGLHRLVFTFQKGGLTNMELQYQKDGWNFATYDEFMHRVRQSLDSRYGTAKPRARKKGESEQVWQTIVRYAWPVGTQEVELVYFAAQDEKNAFNLVSLHYAAEAKPVPAQKAGQTSMVRRSRPAYAPGEALGGTGDEGMVSGPGAPMSPEAAGADELALFPETAEEPVRRRSVEREETPRSRKKVAMAYAEPELPRK